MIYGATLLAVAIAAIIRWILNPVLGENLPYPTFFITVAFAAWLGGWRPAALASGLGLFCVLHLIIPLPRTDSISDWLGLVLYILVCVVFAIFGETMHRSRARLAEVAERLRTTLASIGDAVITTDTAGRITNMNAIAETLTHWSTAEALGQPLESVFRIVNETTRKNVDSPVLRALREGVVVGLANHTILIAKDGTEYPIDDSAAPIRCKDGEIVGCVLIFRDIGHQKALQRQASILAAIVHSSDDAIISKSLDGIIQSWNAAAERLFGYTAEQAIGQPMTLVIPVDRHHEEVEILSRLRAGIRIEHFDTVRVRKDGRLVHVSLTISPIRDESGVSNEFADKFAKQGLMDSRSDVQLQGFTTGYIESRKDLKANSIKNFVNTAKALIKYFGPEKELRSIKVGDCDSWRQHLVNSGLAQATISKLVKQARQFFKVATRRGLIDANPFADLKAGSQRNEARSFFVKRDVIAQVIKQIKLPDLAMAVYLCRYGGLRCPSEVLTLRWIDIDWATNRILVQSPKGEKHGKGVRPMPLFPELVEPLREAQARDDKHPVFVIKRYRDKDKTNLRTHLTRILKKMGIERWPRLFHNLRASRETELASKFPIQVVTAWLGNSPIVALQHYLQTTSEHFDRAIKEDTSL